MKLVIETNGRRLTFENSNKEMPGDLWATSEREDGIWAIAIRLDHEDCEKIAGFLEAWLQEKDKPL